MHIAFPCVCCVTVMKAATARAYEDHTRPNKFSKPSPGDRKPLIQAGRVQLPPVGAKETKGGGWATTTSHSRLKQQATVGNREEATVKPIQQAQ
jgi:hypothetical protein